MSEIAWPRPGCVIIRAKDFLLHGSLRNGDDEWAVAQICGRDGRLSVEQIRAIRELAKGYSAAVIADRSNRRARPGNRAPQTISPLNGAM